MSTMADVDPNLAAAVAALAAAGVTDPGDDASQAAIQQYQTDLLSYAANQDTLTPTGDSPIGTASPGDTGGPAISGTPSAGAAAAIAAANAAASSGSGGGGGGGGGSTTTTTTTTAIDPATGYPYGSAGDTAALAAQTTLNTNNAVNSISSTLASLGLGGMSSWATTTVSMLVGKGIDPTTAVNTVLAEMNAPEDADGSVDQAALDAFNTALPGFNQLIANTGQNGSPGASPAQAIAAYITYRAQVQAFETQAGMPAGTISATDIGDLWANQVSTGEASDRITESVSNANLAMANPNIGTYLQSQGLSTGMLAAYYINPTNTMQTLNSLNTGVAGAATGFGDMSQAQSQALAAFLSQPSSNGVSAVTTQQALGALTSPLGGGMTSAAGMATAGFEQAQLGTSTSAANPGVVSSDQILGAVEGNQPDVVAARRATETRSAASSGGGGLASDQAGVVGVGYGQQ